MRILFLSNINNYHTIKWCRYFSRRGHDVHVAGFERPGEDAAAELAGVHIHWLENGSKRLGSELQKLGYMTTVGEARRLIDGLAPDVVHAHYASSYGLVCSLACRRPYYLSVWGNDVYAFPRRSPLHRLLLKKALRGCTWLLSTSEAMAQETRKYTDKPIAITPFGVDMELFSPDKRDRSAGGFVIGTVKGLERKYGIDTLLRAVAELHGRRPDLGVELRIAGAGTQESELKGLAESLGMGGYVDWLGFIPQREAAREWANFDVGVVASESESFGVSAVECQASGTPLVITDIPGLMEACDGGGTALVVPRSDYGALSYAIERLADDPSLRISMGARGRRYVAAAYEVDACFSKVEDMYERNMEAQR